MCAGATYGKGPTFTGVDAQGNIQQPRPSAISGPTTQIGADGKPMKGDFYYRETGPNPADSPLSKAIDPLEDYDGPAYDAQTMDRDIPIYDDPTGSRSKMKGKFAGKKISGNTVNSVTPDAPKAVTSGEPFNMKKAFDEGVAQGMTGRQSQKNAERLARLAKIKGKGKGKGKLFTTLGAVGLAALIEKGNK